MAVTNKTYAELLSLIESKFGAGNLAAVEQTAVLQLVNNRAYEAYQTSPSWPRYLVTGEPRTIIANQVIPYDEDGFNVIGAGHDAANGLYQSAGEHESVALYLKDGNTLSFKISVYAANTDYVGTYKLDSSYDLGGSSYDKGVWVNQTNPNKVMVYKHDSNRWDLYDISTGSSEANHASEKLLPWQTGFSGVTFVDTPDEAYALYKPSTWKIIKETPTASTNLYMNGSAALPTESSWAISNALNPAPVVFDLESIMEFVRVHRNRPLLNNSTAEYEFYVDDRGANLMNVFPTDSGSAFATYKKEFVAIATDSTIPREWFFFIAHGVYADLLRIEGKTEEGIAEETVAQNYLSIELEKVNNMNNTNVLRKFSTHVSSQSRSI